MSDELEVRVVDASGPYLLALSGELDPAGAAKLTEAVAEADGSTVVVDLANVTFCDSSGITALLLARRSVMEKGHGFALRGAQGIVRRVFEVTGLVGLLED